MKKQFIYNAGPLFSEYEKIQRKKEGELLRNLLNKLNIEYEIGNPIDFDVNPEKEGAPQPEPSVIYECDALFIDKTNVFFFDIFNEDPGTMIELGMALEKVRMNKEIKIYPVNSDFRVFSNTRKGFHSTIGFNSFMIGGIQRHGFKLYSSFEEALKAYEKDLKND